MIALDPILLQFLDGNAITIGMALVILKGLATITPGAKDSKILQLFTVVLQTLTGRRGKNPNP